VLKQLAAADPQLARAIAKGFDDAASQLEKMTLTPRYAFSKETVEGCGSSKNCEPVFSPKATSLNSSTASRLLRVISSFPI
jgi:hypothetical protein